MRCPYCGSRNTRKRWRFYRRFFRPWRCRQCNRTFSGQSFKVWLILALLLLGGAGWYLYLNPDKGAEIEATARNIIDRTGLDSSSFSAIWPQRSSDYDKEPLIHPSQVATDKETTQPPNHDYGTSKVAQSEPGSKPSAGPAGASDSVSAAVPNETYRATGSTEGTAGPLRAPSPTPYLKPTATSVPTERPTPTPLPLPHLRHLKEKELMLELINRERTKAGLSPVELGTNLAAQIHAESSLENCTSSHWGVDGLKPYMRYSLAGGYQSNGENGHGLDYCITGREKYRAISNIEGEIREAMSGWMRSPGHRSNILDKWHKKVNIGLAWDRYNIVAYQHFEGDHVRYEALPTIEDGILSLEGTTKNRRKLQAQTRPGGAGLFRPAATPVDGRAAFSHLLLHKWYPGSRYS